MGSHVIPQSTDAREVMDNIRRLVQVLRVASRDAEKRLGISGAQLFVLARLHQAGAPLSVNELAERTLTHQSSVSVVVSKLVDAGLLSRSHSRDDHRRLELSLTAKARRLLARAPEAAQERLLEALEQMKPRRREQLADLLGEVVAAVGADETTPSMFFEGKRKRANARA